MTSQPRSRSCPRCAVPLLAGRPPYAEVFACGRCGGVWLPRAWAERLAKGLPADLLVLADAAGRRAPVREVDTAPADLPCPSCAQAMARTRIPPAAVDVDVCARHGTWLDRGELHAIARALAAAAARRSRTLSPEAVAHVAPAVLLASKGVLPGEQDDAGTGVANAVNSTLDALNVVEGIFQLLSLFL
ncbi:MAG: zf-TFIIB domain-containing protein [Planctomycetes bacterium]|nr:zf-TFIIB domain-containing protein [Planctomycetota bacterium]